MIIRIGIAHHNNELVRFLRKCLEGQEDFSVAWTAVNGPEALIQMEKNRTDVVLLEIGLPVMDGVLVTREIMEKNPCSIIILTSNNNNHFSEIFRAMGFGAMDTVEAGIGEDGPRVSENILYKKIRKAGILKKSADAETGQKRTQPIRERKIPQVPLVIIGSSTGGPKTLARILAELSGQASVSIVIIQHVLEEFSENLVRWLAKQAPLKVELAREGAGLEPGTIYVAGTNDHMVLTPDLRFAYVSEPKEAPYRPSVNVFFHSVAQHWPDKGLAIILTGMGNDGARGLMELRDLGWHTIAQDEATSAVYGMPKAAVQMNAVVESLPVDAIASAVIEFLSNAVPGA